MRADRTPLLEPIVDPMAQPVTERLPEPPVDVHFAPDRAGDPEWDGVKL